MVPVQRRYDNIMHVHGMWNFKQRAANMLNAERGRYHADHSHSTFAAVDFNSIVHACVLSYLLWSQSLSYLRFFMKS